MLMEELIYNAIEKNQYEVDGVIWIVEESDGEDERDYTFSGKPTISNGVQLLLSQAEIETIFSYLKRKVAEEHKIKPVQVFYASDSRVVLAIDTLSETKKQGLNAEELDAYDGFSVLMRNEF